MPSPQRILLAGDLHVPYHSVPAVRALLRRLREWQPNHLVLLGDLLDARSISKYCRHPDTPRLHEEIAIAKNVLAQIRDALAPSGGKLHFTGGNHEERLTKYLWRQAPGLAGLPGLSLREQLGFSTTEWYPYGTLAKVPGVAAYHGSVVRAAAGASVLGEMQRWGSVAPLLAIGHVHRLAVVSKTDGCGTRWGVECGCLADPDQQDYIVGIANWQLGWVEVTHRRGSVPLIRPVYL